MTDAILIFSIGPVQSFIAESRRTQDLWASSHLLCEITRAAIQAFQSAGAEVIYPADPTQESLPNRFVVQIPTENIPQATEEAQKEAQKALRQVAEEARKYLEQKGAQIDATWEAIWERQLSHHLEFFWAAAEIDGDYKSAYEQANRAFEAAKRTRAFVQVEEEGPKDSLSGRRSALHTDGLHPRDYWRQIGEKVGPSELRPFGRERLDALGVTKRFGYRRRFPSTSTVTVVPFLNKARRIYALKIYKNILHSIPKFYRVSDDPDWPYDGDLLFKETLTPDRLQDDYGFTEDDFKLHAERLKILREALQTLYKEVGSRPPIYYAILAMDGDSMGAHIGTCTSKEEHRELNCRLANFAKEVHKIVEANQGSLVYAGGDDVLAFFPLASALRAALKLATTYKQYFQDWAQKYPHHVLPFTNSAGIAVVHHRYPLDAALRAAWEAERKAKKMQGKDAIAVAVLRRSGERAEMRSRWEGVEHRFGQLCQWFSDGALSSRFAYDVADSARRLEGLTGPFQAELKRLFRRHRDEKKPSPPDPEKAAADLMDWASTLSNGFVELANWILLARFVALGGGE
jgi:CRISPR-associated protein Cmr2